MKVNQSLRTFSVVVRTLWIAGVVLILLAIWWNETLASDLLEGSDQAFIQWLSFRALPGAVFNIGVLLVALAIFGAFLRITAKSVIEGLGGNISTSTRYFQAIQAPQTPHFQTRTAVEEDNSPETRSVSKQGQTNSPLAAISSDLWQQLNGGDYKAWILAGQPSLKEWDEAGQPDLKTWLKSRETEK